MTARDKFRESVFERDNHKCVICGEPAIDAHHIMERRLFDDGGYHLNNGASVCAKHHLEAEMTLITCEELREACGITEIVLPDHLYDSQRYDKWGNQILSKMRLKGELFNDESVQKILKKGNVLNEFTDLVKYPRTFHLPWSPGKTRDDRMLTLEQLKEFRGKKIVITEKRDGENTSLYDKHRHARSLELDNHPSRKWLSEYWGRHFAYQNKIPEGWRVCGENLYAEHSIAYNELDTFFEMFSIWDDKNICLSWDDTKEWSELLDIKLVPVVFEGIWDDIFETHTIPELDEYMKYNKDKVEGYVIRLQEEFHYSEFRKKVGKFVRAGHVQTHGKEVHWKNNWKPNKLK